MFGRKDKAPEGQAHGRYYVQSINIGLKSQDKHAANLQEALNEGDSKKWTLLNVSSYGGNIPNATLLFWDTQSQ